MARRHQVSLADLHDELLQQIMLRVTKVSLHDGVQLIQVSKVFNMQWKSTLIRRECALHQHPFVPLFRNSVELKRLVVAMNAFQQAGNPETLFQGGITNRFDRRRTEQRPEGLQQLKSAAQTGHLKAQHIYGLILVCGGGERKQEGYDMLDTLLKPALFESLNEMERRRVDLRNTYLVFLQGGIATAIELLRGYVRDMDNECGEQMITDLQRDVLRRSNFGNLFEPFDGCPNFCWHLQIKMLHDLILDVS